MPILIMCPNPACGELFDAPEASPGGAVRCPACGTAVTVAAQPAPAAAPPPAATPGLVELDLGDTGRGEGRGERGEGRHGDAGKGDAETRRGERKEGRGERGEGRHGDAGRRDSERRDEGAKGAPPAREEVTVEDLFAAKGAPAAGAIPRAAPRPPRTSGEGAGAPGPPEASAFAGSPPAPGTAKEDLLGEFWAGVGPAGEPAGDSAPAAVGADSEMPDRRPVAALVLVLGLVGMAAGVAYGLWAFPEWRLLAAYVGAGLGWVAGFTFGAMLVLGFETEGGQVRCYACGQVAAAGADSCPRCGGPLAGPAADPIAAECLCAGSYALSNAGGLMGLILLTVAGQLVVSISWELMQAYRAQSGDWWPAVIALWAVAGFVVFAYWADYLLSVISQTIARPFQPARAPPAPRLGSFRMLAAGGQGLAALVVYVAPLVTVPLLPLAALLLAYPAGKAAMNPAAAARAAWRHAKGFAVLWLFLLMWLAGTALAGVVVWILYGLRHWLPPVDRFTESILSVTLSASAVALAALVAGIFGVAMARCVGALGRYRPDLFPFAPGGRKTSVQPRAAGER